MLTRRSLPAAVAGAALGLLLVTVVDARVTTPPLVDAGAARTLFGGMLASLITVAAVLFWIRGTFVQMAAAQFSARVVQGHLSDRHEQRALPFLVGAFAYTAVVLLGVPADGPAPTVATGVALVVAVAAFLTVVRTIEVGLRMSQPSYLVLALARHAVQVIRSALPEGGHGPTAPADLQPPPSDDAVSVEADASGWLTGVDQDRLLRALPAAATLQLRATHGQLITPGYALALVFGTADGTALAEEIRRAVALTDRRPADDVDVVLRELVDVTAQAMAPGSADALRGYEAMDALAWVLTELLSRDVPATVRERDGRTLLLAAEPSHAERLRAVLEPLAEVVGQWVVPTRALEGVLDAAAERLERSGLADRAGLLRAVWADVRP